MQTNEAMSLQKRWAEKESPPCDHPRTEKEYYLGSATGDRVCTTCGECFPR